MSSELFILPPSLRLAGREKRESHPGVISGAVPLMSYRLKGSACAMRSSELITAGAKSYGTLHQARRNLRRNRTPSKGSTMRVRKWFVAMVVFFLLVVAVPSKELLQSFPDAKPSPQQLEWQDLEIGVLIHFGLNTFCDQEWSDGTVSPKIFNPTEFNAEQWIRAAKSADAKYVIFVAKHIDGFCLWPSAYTSYTVAASPWRNGKGNVVKEVATACRKEGLKFGIYLAPWDRHEPFYNNEAAYDNFYEEQLEELIQSWENPTLGSHNQLLELWLDGAGSYGHHYNWDLIVRTLRAYEPNTLILSDVGFMPWQDLRWGGNEDGAVPEENWDVAKRLGDWRWRPAESDTPLHSAGWFWHPHPSYSQSLKSTTKLLETYNQTVGRGANLLLGLEPDDRGLVPDADAARLREFGEAVRRIYGPQSNLASKGTPHSDVEGNVAAAFDGDPDTFWIASPNARSATIEVSFHQPIRFDRTVVMEWLNDGQHIEKYEIQAWKRGSWETLQAGTSIGHKKIDIFPVTTAVKVRLRILMASGSPAIREFEILDGPDR